MDRAGSLILVSKGDQDRQAYCLESKPFTLWLQNLHAVPVMLDCVRLTFRSPYPVLSEVLTSTHGCSGKILAPLSKIPEPVRVTIEPGLLFQLNSNPINATADVWVQEATGPTFLAGVAIQGPDWIMVHEAEVFERKQVFVSFKDEEDLILAELARDLLRKAGFTPYLARENRDTGSSQWDQKILPAIRDSIATLVIWTANTVADPDEVLRELQFSQAVGVPAGLFRGDNASLPEEYPASVLEYLRFESRAPWVPFAQAITSAARRHSHGQQFFGGVTSGS